MLPIMLAIFLVNLGAISSSSSPPDAFSGVTANPHSALMHKSIYSCGDDYDCWRRPLGYSSTCVNEYCICSFGYANNMTNERCTRIECTNHFQCSAHFDYSQCVDSSCVCYGNYTLNMSTVECEPPTGGLPLGAILGIVGGVIAFFILIVVLVMVLRRQKMAKPGRPIQTQAPHHPSVGMVAFAPGTAHPQQQFPLQPVGEQARQTAFHAAYPQVNYYPQQPAPFVYSNLQGPYQGPPPPLPQAPPEYSPPYSQPEDGFQKAHYQLPSTSNDTPTAPKI